MKIPIIDINTANSVADKIRFCFWAYLLLLIFEGALRKWIFPGLSDLFLVIRDPLVLYVTFMGLKYRLFRSNIINILIAFSIVNFMLSLIFGHHNLFVALYGTRITLFHIPSIFIFGKILTQKDIHLIGKTVLYISILMFFIVLLQYFSPKTAWINRGVGGIGTAGGSGIAGYMRPSGTFSFTSGMAGFELLVGLFFFYFLCNNNRLNGRYKLKPVVLYIVAITFLFSIPLCLSRTVIFQTSLMFLLMLICSLYVRGKIAKIISISFILISVFFFLKNINAFNVAFENIFLRFEAASQSEGDVLEGTLGNRYFGTFYRAFFDTQNYSNKEIPFWGFGLGIGTKVGEAILNIRSEGHSFAFAEEEWSRIICEIGLFQGIFFLLGIRMFYPIYLVLNALKYVRKRKDVFLFMSIVPFLLYFVKNQWTVPTSLGFTVVLSTLFVAAYNRHNYYKL